MEECCVVFRRVLTFRKVLGPLLFLMTLCLKLWTQICFYMLRTYVLVPIWIRGNRREVLGQIEKYCFVTEGHSVDFFIYTLEHGHWLDILVTGYKECHSPFQTSIVIKIWAMGIKKKIRRQFYFYFCRRKGQIRRHYNGKNF